MVNRQGDEIGSKSEGNRIRNEQNEVSEAIHTPQPQRVSYSSPTRGGRKMRRGGDEEGGR